MLFRSLQQVSEKLLGQFVESLEAKLAAENAGVPQGSTDTAEEASAEEPIRARPASPVPGTRQDPAPEPEPIDLLQLAGGGQLMKYGSAVAALLAGLVLIWVLRRRR